MSCGTRGSETLLIAVAANFARTAAVLAEHFEGATKTKVELSIGSTGKLHAQIVNGAPHGLFLAADAERPQRLFDQGIGIGAPRTYALGQLVLWAPGVSLAQDPQLYLRSGPVRSLAMANWRLAPYGLASRAVLERIGAGVRFGLANSVPDELVSTGASLPRLVMAENVGQTYALIASGSVDAAFVAAAQLRTAGIPPATLAQESWQVPVGLHEPIVQQVLLLEDSPAAMAFFDFLVSDDARQIIAAAGYLLPPATGSNETSQQRKRQ